MAKETQNENVEVVAEAVSKTEIFFRKNRNILITILAAVVVAAAAYFCWYKFAFQPKQAEALEQMSYADRL